MESIVIYPENKTQQSLLKKLFKEMRIRFEVAARHDTLNKIDEYDKKLKLSIKQAESENTYSLTPHKQKELLGL